jgi:DNA-directed RNA polymerase subunit omega
MRDDYLKAAMAIVKDPNVLVNIVSKRVKQLKFGSAPMVESLEKLLPEDIALKEIIDGRLKFRRVDEDMTKDDKDGKAA